MKIQTIYIYTLKYKIQLKLFKQYTHNIAMTLYKINPLRIQKNSLNNQKLPLALWLQVKIYILLNTLYISFLHYQSSGDFQFYSFRHLLLTSNMYWHILVIKTTYWGGVTSVYVRLCPVLFGFYETTDVFFGTLADIDGHWRTWTDIGGLGRTLADIDGHMILRNVFFVDYNSVRPISCLLVFIIFLFSVMTEL